MADKSIRRVRVSGFPVSIIGLTELKIPASVDHVMDIKEIARYGIMGSPALLINGRAVAVGSVPHRDRIKKWLSEANGSSGRK